MSAQRMFRLVVHRRIRRRDVANAIERWGRKTAERWQAPLRTNARRLGRWVQECGPPDSIAAFFGGVKRQRCPSYQR